MVLTVESLSAAFDAMRPLVEAPPGDTYKQAYDTAAIARAFAALAEPLGNARADGRILNLWAVAGLRRDEVRNSAALAGLWSPAFGGQTSRRFLVNYLNWSISGINWEQELQAHYRVTTEENPLGDRGSRVDIIIETPNRIIAIEVKIDAGLGDGQLGKYLAAIRVRAELCGLRPHLLLLAPFASPLPDVASTSWRDVARAAHNTVSSKRVDRGFLDRLIASFGDHVSKFGGR